MAHMRKLRTAKVGAQEQPRSGRRALLPGAEMPLCEPRQTARERYESVLPRWMRSKEPAGRQEQNRGRRR
jgi:hypothetical protein